MISKSSATRASISLVSSKLGWAQTSKTQGPVSHFLREEEIFSLLPEDMHQRQEKRVVSKLKQVELSKKEKKEK